MRSLPVLLGAPLSLLSTSCQAQNAAAPPASAKTSSSAKISSTAPQTIDAGATFGPLRLVDEINCGAPNEAHQFVEVPAGASKIETILGQPCRVSPHGWQNEAGWGAVSLAKP